MTNIQKWQGAMAELLRDAGRSDRQIAEALCFSASFVGKVRKALEADGKLQPGKRVGQDGRRRGLPRNLKAMRERLLALLKGQKKRRKDIDDLAAWVQRMTAKQLEEYLAALEGERVFAPGQPEASPPTDEPVQPTEDELVRWGLVAGLILMHDYTEEEAMKVAEEMLGDVKEEKDRQQLIDQGKMYLEHRRASEQGNAGQQT